MQLKSKTLANFEIPEELLQLHCFSKAPAGLITDNPPPLSIVTDTVTDPSLVTGHLPQILEWLHGLDKPRMLERNTCDIPLLLFDHVISMDRILFHYDGTSNSAKIIKNFIALFSDLINESKVTIISPSFIPKSKLVEERQLIELINAHTAETSFIKFNFSKIGDFWSYATKHECNLLVTSKSYQADLAKVLFHFYKGERWYDKLSIYLAQ